MNDTLESLPNGDFRVIPAKKPAPQPVKKKEPIRSRPKKG